MDDREIEQIAAWAVAEGIAGNAGTTLLQDFCDRCCGSGLPLSRALALIDTLHPIYEGRAFRWRSDGVPEQSLVDYGRTTEGDAAAGWQRTTFYRLLSRGESELRLRFCDGEGVEFPGLDTMRSDGDSDYIAFVHRFVGDGAIGEMDAVYSHWTTRRPGGFRDDEVAALRRLVPPLALAIKAVALARIAATLVGVYLGRDAGRRVLEGRIQRGIADRIGAVLWFSDLQGYTTITDTAPPDEIIPLLNDYAEAVIAAIHEAGGDVLKLVGDGVLALFQAATPAAACACALSAAADLRRRLQALNASRAAAGRPVTQVYLGLHIGEVFYGNIGSDDRLDFTAVGPAVNEVSRIAALCRSVDRPVVLSADFAAAAAPADRATLVSVGRYALRGVGRAQELFTIDPALL